MYSVYCSELEREEMKERMQKVEDGTNNPLQLSNARLTQFEDAEKHVKENIEFLNESERWRSHPWLQGLQHVQISEEFPRKH
jgi:hypothetical protein